MEEEKVLYNVTVCYPAEGNEILLGIKVEKIGKGCWNGYGGGIEKGEKPKEAAVRELEDETGGMTASPEHLEKIAIACFHNVKSNGEAFDSTVHFYLARECSGEAKDTTEMINPTRFDINDLPLDKMMLADKYWLPIALSGQKVMVKATYGPFQKTLLGKVEVQWVNSFPPEQKLVF